jgi:prepilin-type N-terminal cleavage/methylation domain-containing protein
LALHPTTRAGFTIVEMLVSMALLAMIMLAAALAIQAATTSHEYNSEKARLVAQARGVLDRIARDARKAKSIAVADDHTLVITMPNDDLHSYGRDNTDPTSLVYIQTVNDVQSSAVILAGCVQTFTVTDQTPASLIQIVLKGTYAQESITATVTPRKWLF